MEVAWCVSRGLGHLQLLIVTLLDKKAKET